MSDLVLWTNLVNIQVQAPNPNLKFVYIVQVNVPKIPLHIVYRLNCVLPFNLYVEVLASGASECDLIWKPRHCRYIMSHTAVGCAPNPI